MKQECHDTYDQRDRDDALDDLSGLRPVKAQGPADDQAHAQGDTGAGPWRYKKAIDTGSVQAAASGCVATAAG